MTQARYTGTVEPSNGGAGVAGATVSLINSDTDVVITTTTSDSSGNFSVDAEMQTVKFSASKSGGEALVVTNGNVESLAPGTDTAPKGILIWPT